MDTGKVLLRQCRYSLAAAETEEQKAQVVWWTERLTELRKQQPSAEPSLGPAEEQKESAA